MLPWFPELFQFDIFTAIALSSSSKHALSVCKTTEQWKNLLKLFSIYLQKQEVKAVLENLR